MNSTITTVFLDAGGVILDETEHENMRADVIVASLTEVVKGYSLADYAGDIEEAVHAFAPDAYRFVFQKHLNHNADLLEDCYNKHKESFERRKPRLQLAEGARSEIGKLAQNFSLGIAGQYGIELKELLKAEDVLKFFAHPFTYEDFPVTKPDPEFYRLITKSIGIEPANCIMVGDRIDKDIIPARSIGMKTILIHTGLHVNQQPRSQGEAPDAELGSVEGLAEVVQELAGGA